MNIIDIKLSDIHPYEHNPRRNDEAVMYVKNSIKEFGMKVPLVIDRNNVIVAGHTRYQALVELGWESAPCLIADDLTEEQVKAFRLADNRVGEIATWDLQKLDEELAGIGEIDMSEFHFSLDDIKPDSFGDCFTLPDNDTPKTNQITVILSARQKEEVLCAMEKVKGDAREVDGNTNVMGNCFYEVVRQWEELKK